MERFLRYRGKERKPGSSSNAPREDRERSLGREHSKRSQTQDTDTPSSGGYVENFQRSMQLRVNSWIGSTNNKIRPTIISTFTGSTSRVGVDDANTSWEIMQFLLTNLVVIVRVIWFIILEESQSGGTSFVQIFLSVYVQAVFLFTFLVLAYLHILSTDVVTVWTEDIVSDLMFRDVYNLTMYLMFTCLLKILLDLPKKTNVFLLQTFIDMNVAFLISTALLLAFFYPMRESDPIHWRIIKLMIVRLPTAVCSLLLVSQTMEAFPFLRYPFPLLALIFRFAIGGSRGEWRKSSAGKQGKRTAQGSVKTEERTLTQEEELQLSLEKLRRERTMMRRVREEIEQVEENRPFKLEIRLQKRLDNRQKEVPIMERAPSTWRKETTDRILNEESQGGSHSRNKQSSKRSTTLPAEMQSDETVSDDLRSKEISMLLPVDTPDVILDDRFLYTPPSADNPTRVNSPTSLNGQMAEKRTSLLSQRALLYDVVEGLKRIHREGRVHGELTPKSIVWRETTLRWAIRLPSSEATMSRSPSSEFSSEYMAPELLHSAEDPPALNASMDMWSFGVIAFEVIAGTQFYGSPALPDPSSLTQRGIARRIRVIQNRDASDLLLNLIVLEPESRWSAIKAASSAFFTEAQNVSDAEMPQKQDARMDKCCVCHLRETVLEANGDESVLISICIEQYYAPGDPADRFGLLTGRAVPVHLDAFFYRRDPIFLLHIGQKYQIRACIRSNKKLPADMRLDHVFLKPSDGEGKKLEIISSQTSGDGFEVVALLDLGSLSSKRLHRIPSPHSKSEEDYVPLFLEVEICVDSNSLLPSLRLRSSLISKMVPRHIMSPKRDFRKTLEESKKRMPQWMHGHLRGACFVLDTSPFKL